MSAPQRPRVAVVLAAGKGTRMRSSRPKVLHEVAGRPMLAWVIDAARAAGCSHILVIVGHGAEAVREAFAGQDDLGWVLQREQRGTGHALAQAAAHVPGEALLLVLSGDVPLLTPGTLERLASEAEAGWGSMAVATLENPGALGRVLGADGRLERIVEAADATEEERTIRVINAGIYALPAPAIFDHLDRLDTDNAQGELYLTDAVGDAARAGNAVVLSDLEDPSEALGINDRLDLAAAHRALLDRQARRLAEGGVTVLEPDRTAIGVGVTIGEDTVVHPGVTLLGDTVIGRECTLHAGVWIQDATIADGCEIKPYSVIENAEVGPRSTVGPFARLRPASVLGEGSRVGNFVELKKAHLGAGAKVGHLTYLGDAEVGARTNIGAGVVTCNYDGVAKHRTTIGEDAFVGSDTMLVAPVTVGDRATTGAGSVINQDVPADALGVGRARQRNIPGWTDRKAGKRDRS